MGVLSMRLGSGLGMRTSATGPQLRRMGSLGTTRKGGAFLSLYLVTMDHSCCTLSDLLLAPASIMNLQEKISVHLSSKRCCMIQAKAFKESEWQILFSTLLLSRSC